MRVSTLRRAGFGATLLTGLVLTGSALHGLSGVDTTLELAAAPPVDRPVLVSHRWDAPPHHRAGECERPDDRHRI